MKLYEYQAKAIFAQKGIPIPRGNVVKSVAEIDAFTSCEFPVVVKSQVLIGGRGKAGGIAFANDFDELRTRAKQLFNSTIKGLPVQALLIEKKVEHVDEECYLSVTLDRASRKPLIIFSRSGGVDIEQVAKTDPLSIAKVLVDPAMGLRQFHLERLMRQGNVIDPDVKTAIQKVVRLLYGLYAQHDALLVEINPLMILADKTVIAADGKMQIDKSALFRHPDLAELEKEFPVDQLEKEATSLGLNYINVTEDGNVGAISNGAGMLMSCIDWLTRSGGQVASAIDLGGGVTADEVARGIRIVSQHGNVQSILINVFGGITRCDEVAGGILKIIAEQDFNIPIVVRLEGTNKEKGLNMLAGVDGKRLIITQSLPEAAKAALAILNIKG